LLLSFVRISVCPPLYAYFIRIHSISPVRNCEKTG
jgi:hypothetical protein